MWKSRHGRTKSEKHFSFAEAIAFHVYIILRRGCGAGHGLGYTIRPQTTARLKIIKQRLLVNSAFECVKNIETNSTNDLVIVGTTTIYKSMLLRFLSLNVITYVECLESGTSHGMWSFKS